MTDLYGVHTTHSDLEDGSYESPAAFADQGDTRVVRDLLFNYLAATEDAAGNQTLMPVDCPRGTELTIEQMGLLALKKGEKHHSFYTTKERDAIENPAAAFTSDAVATGDLTSLGEYELAEWLSTPTPESGKEPTINDVLERVGDDKEFAHRMLQAENIATDGEPRKGLEAGLSAIIQG